MIKIIKKFGLIVSMFLFLFTVNAKAENWRIQAHLPSGHTVYQFMADWVDEVNTMLGGRLTLELFPAKAIIPIVLIIQSYDSFVVLNALTNLIIPNIRPRPQSIPSF